MKWCCFILIFFMSCSSSEVQLDGPGVGGIFEDSVITINADVESITVKAKKDFFFIRSISFLEDNKSVIYYTDETEIKAQRITNDSYVVETELGNAGKPNSIHVALPKNQSTIYDRELQIEVFSANQAGRLKIIQKRK